MQTDFTSVEAELQEIESDFSSGRMNAFGSAQAQDAFLRELKRIAEVETQVFYRTCSILKSGNSDDHAVLTGVFASARPPPQAAANNHGGGTTTATDPSGRTSPLSQSTPVGSSHRRGTSTSGGGGGGFGRTGGGSFGAFASPGGSLASLPTLVGEGSASGGRFATSAASRSFGYHGSGAGSGAAPHIKSREWGNESGFPDNAFENVAQRFKLLEADFNVLGAQLRQVSTHVVQLNDMSEEVNRSMGMLNPQQQQQQQQSDNSSSSNGGVAGGGGGGGSRRRKPGGGGGSGADKGGSEPKGSPVRGSNNTFNAFNSSNSNGAWRGTDDLTATLNSASNALLSTTYNHQRLDDGGHGGEDDPSDNNICYRTGNGGLFGQSGGCCGDGSSAYEQRSRNRR